MILIELTSNDGTPLKLFLTGKNGLAICTDGGQTYFLDGLHRNGGWKVKESPDEITAKLALVGLVDVTVAVDEPKFGAKKTRTLNLTNADTDGLAIELGDEMVDRLLRADGGTVEVVGHGPDGYSDIKLKDGTVINSLNDTLLV